MPEPITTVAEAVRPPRDAPPAGSDFAPLLRTVKGQGLLDRRRTWYALTIAANALALAAVVTGIAVTGGSWWSLLLAPLLAIFPARTAFLGHDAGHSQITGDRTAARLIGLIHGNLTLLKWQVLAAAWVIVWSGCITFILLKVVGLFVPLRMSKEAMDIGDVAEHDQEVYPSDVPSLG